MLDDVYWVDDVQMSNFPDPGAIYSPRFGFLCNPDITRRRAADIKESTGQDRDEPNMNVIMLGGDIAGRALSAYSEYYTNPSAKLDNVVSPEDFLYTLAEIKGIPYYLTEQR